MIQRRPNAVRSRASEKGSDHPEVVEPREELGEFIVFCPLEEVTSESAFPGCVTNAQQPATGKCVRDSDKDGNGATHAKQLARPVAETRHTRDAPDQDNPCDHRGQHPPGLFLHARLHEVRSPQGATRSKQGDAGEAPKRQDERQIRFVVRPATARGQSCDQHCQRGGTDDPGRGPVRDENQPRDQQRQDGEHDRSEMLDRVGDSHVRLPLNRRFFMVWFR